MNWQISHLYAISTLHRYLSRNNPAFNRCYTIYALEKELITCLKATHVQERHVCSKINTLPSVSAHMNYMHQETHHGTLDGIMAGTAVLTHPHGKGIKKEMNKINVPLKYPNNKQRFSPHLEQKCKASPLQR